MQQTLDARTIEKAVRETLETVLDDLYRPDAFTVEGGFDPAEHELSVTVTAPSSKDFEPAVLETFYDLFFTLEVPGEPSCRYRFRWKAVQDGSVVDEYLLETDLARMPDTGGVTREAWEAFVEQLIYQRNGRPQELPEPEDFLEE